MRASIISIKADSTFLLTHTYSDPGYSYLMGHKKSSHTASVTYPGTIGEKYYAVVHFYAGERGVAGGGDSQSSAIITARK